MSEGRDDILADIREEIRLTRNAVELSREEFLLSRENNVRANAALDRSNAALERNSIALDRYAGDSFDLREFTRDLTREFRASMGRLTAGLVRGFDEMRAAQLENRARLNDLLDENRAQRRALLAILDRFERPGAGGAPA